MAWHAQCLGAETVEAWEDSEEWRAWDDDQRGRAAAAALLENTDAPQEGLDEGGLPSLR